MPQTPLSCRAASCSDWFGVICSRSRHTGRVHQIAHTVRNSDLPQLRHSVRWFSFVPKVVLTALVGQLRHERPYLAATLETQLSEVTVLHA